MCSTAYTSTLCSQINIAPSFSELHIQIEKKELNIEINKKKISLNGSVDIYSEEALEIIDRWINKWTSLIQNLRQQNLFVEIDVTGGFDSRVTLALALASDIDISKINFHSAVNYPVKDDLMLANTLATEFNFSINSNLNTPIFQNLSTGDSWNLSMMTNFSTHHFPYFKSKAYNSSIIKISGQGGETIRNYWYYEPYTFEKKMIDNDLSDKNISLNAIKFLWEELVNINSIYNVDRKDKYKTLFHHLYNEGRAKYHFGRSFV